MLCYVLLAYTELLPTVRIGRKRWYQGGKRVRKIKNSGKEYFERSSTRFLKLARSRTKLYTLQSKDTTPLFLDQFSNLVQLKVNRGPQQISLDSGKDKTRSVFQLT